jgi:hypothetical protein
MSSKLIDARTRCSCIQPTTRLSDTCVHCTNLHYNLPYTGKPSQADQPLIYRTSDSDPSINPCIIPRYNRLSTTNRLSSIAPNTGNQNKSRLASISTRSVISFKGDRKIKRQNVSCVTDYVSCAFKLEPVLLELLTHKFISILRNFTQKSSIIAVLSEIRWGRYA